MKSIVLCCALVCMAALSACSTTSDASIEQTVCTHQIVTTQAAELALSNAALIKDPAAQAAAIAAANASLSLVAGCAGYTGPTPVVSTTAS